MKSARLRYRSSKTASRLHLAIGQILRTHDLFKNLQCYQEYPVKRINPSFKSNRERFDWVIKDWNVVIECHGAFHTHEIPWGNREEAKIILKKQQRRDEVKKQAAHDAGWTYIALTDKEILSGITGEELYAKIQDSRRLVPVCSGATDTRFSQPVAPTKENSNLPRTKASERFHDEQKKRTREYRRRQYQRLKELTKRWEQDRKKIGSNC